MEEMERGSISEMALEGKKRGLSYGQYVAARYYPVMIVEKLPDGGQLVRRAALPPVVPGWEEAIDRHRRRSVDGPVRSNRPKKEKPGRKCVVCGEPLGQYPRKYCGDRCRVQKLQAEGRGSKGYKKAPRVDRPCDVCGKLMRGVLKQTRYCGPQCRIIGNNRRQREWQAAHPVEPEVRYCRVCGIRIEDNGYKYCPNCR